MAVTPVFRGSAPDDGTGDSFYDAAGKLNANDADLDTRVDAAQGAADTADGKAVSAQGDVDGVLGGANATDQTLTAWTEAGAYEATAISFDSDGVVTTATVKWPDGSAGTFTTTATDATWLAVDSYTISHTDSGKTVTQSAVTTRDATTGDVTAKPALTVA